MWQTAGGKYRLRKCSIIRAENILHGRMACNCVPCSNLSVWCPAMKQLWSVLTMAHCSLASIDVRRVEAMWHVYARWRENKAYQIWTFILKSSNIIGSRRRMMNIARKPNKHYSCHIMILSTYVCSGSRLDRLLSGMVLHIYGDSSLMDRGCHQQMPGLFISHTKAALAMSMPTELPSFHCLSDYHIYFPWYR